MRTPFQSLGILASSLWLFSTSGPLYAADESRDGGKPGPYAIGHTSFIVTNDAGRPVATEVWYPVDASDSSVLGAQAVYAMDPYYAVLPTSPSADWEALGYDRAYQEPTPVPGRFPLVMFSSGFTMPAWAYLFAGTRLASHGFVVAVVQHIGEGAWPWDNWDGIATIAFNRPRDLSFALTEVLRRDRTPGDLLHHTIDRKHVVAAGHSFGGYAALAAVGGDDQVCDAKLLQAFGEELPASACQPTLADPRFAALVTLDATSSMLRFEEMARIEKPSLIMGEAGFADDPTDSEYSSFVARPHAAISRSTVSLRIDVRDSDHFSFSNECDGARMLFGMGALSAEDMANYYEPVFCQASLPFAEGHRLITKYLVAFLKAVVLHEPQGQARILTQRDAIAYEPDVELYWHERCPAGARLGSALFTYHQDMAPDACAVGEKNPEAFF